MTARACPPLQRLEVAPILPHPDVQGPNSEQQVFVEQEAVRFVSHRVTDLRTESRELAKSRKDVDLKSQVDDYQLGILA